HNRPINPKNRVAAGHRDSPSRSGVITIIAANIPIVTITKGVVMKGSFTVTSPRSTPKLTCCLPRPQHSSAIKIQERPKLVNSGEVANPGSPLLLQSLTEL